ncbi:MAG: hypothetical protein JO257_14975 [Deltaproteobacteria bacterium]|nr:hypothetical protein [Deltaproteobacteria bacterium]
MNRDLTPTEGVRVLLERRREEGTSCRYRVELFTPDATYAGEATLGEDGSVELQLTAPDELADAARMFAKLTARGAAGRRADGLPPWPARVLRWRGPGRGQGRS